MRFLTRQRDLVALPKGAAEALVAEVARLGDAQLGQTLSALAPKLPIFDVTFGDDAATVTAAGSVPASA